MKVWTKGRQTGRAARQGSWTEAITTSMTRSPCLPRCPCRSRRWHVHGSKDGMGGGYNSDYGCSSYGSGYGGVDGSYSMGSRYGGYNHSAYSSKDGMGCGYGGGYGRLSYGGGYGGMGSMEGSYSGVDRCVQRGGGLA